ncbi:MAG TPA: hypothetical protein VEC93_11600, partial [Anaerolineae bacterium]|nr:hypothetical protein [Anaerolineae bacterium]
MVENSSPKKNSSRLAIGIWSIIAATLGFLFWKTARYSYRLSRQPSYKPGALPADLENHQTVEAKGLLIAAANLRAGIEKRLLLNGQEKLILCAG